MLNYQFKLLHQPAFILNGNDHIFMTLDNMNAVLALLFSTIKSVN